MNDRPPSAHSADDRVLEEIFQQAEPRPRPSAAARDRAFNTLQGEWRQMTTGRRRRRATFFAVAASTVLAVIAGGIWWNDQAAPSTGLTASIVRSTGNEVIVNGGRLAGVTSGGPRLASGDHLRTGHDSRVALLWPGGGSLRLDEATRLRLAANNGVELQTGNVYFDSTPFGGSQARPSTLEVHTPLGIITHVGTQFQARLVDGELSLAVREGVAELNGDRIDVSVAAGEIVHLEADGRFERQRLDSYDDGWQWAADIAPELQLNGRTTHEVLGWIGRETGRDVRYRSAEARRIADSEPRGIGQLPPMPALRTIPVMTTLTVVVENAQITIDVAEHSTTPRRQE